MKRRYLRMVAGALTCATAWGQFVNRTPQIIEPDREGRLGQFGRAYRSPSVTATRYDNSPRLDALIRGNNLYISLADAIALGLENNLDLELLRYGPRIAETDIRRAEAGGLLRGIPLIVRDGPNGVGGPVPATPGNSAAGTAFTLNQPDTSSTQTENNLTLVGTTQLVSGPRIPIADPALTGQFNWINRSTPQTSEFISGTSSLNSRNLTTNFGWQQGFSSGTQVGLGYNNLRQTSNGARIDYNPYTNASLGLTITQPLLQGFGFAVNRRFIRIAKNDRRISDFVYRLQVSVTSSAVIRLYWDFVSLNEDVKVKRQALELSEQLLRNNQSQVEVGTLAPIEVSRAQAEVARSRQDLTNSESLLRQQEVILKNFITRSGTGDPRLRTLHLIPTDPIRVPEHEPIQPLEDLISVALENRPDLAATKIQLDNTDINLKGAKNALLPQVDLIGTLQNNALVGQVNSLVPTNVTPGTPFVRNTDPAFIGGYGSILSQIFSRDFPDYGVALQVTIPLRNRIAQADVARDQLSKRQAEVRVRQLQNQIRVDVEAAVIALQRARATYESAVQTRTLQEQVLEAEQAKYEVGASTTFFVIQYQRDLAQARSAEVIAQSTYVKARAALDRVMGIVLRANHISFAEAYSGEIRTLPGTTPLP